MGLARQLLYVLYVYDNKGDRVCIIMLTQFDQNVYLYQVACTSVLRYYRKQRGYTMNSAQTTAVADLQSLLLSARGITDELVTIPDGDALYTEVNGVTVKIGRKGGYSVPDVRSYPETKEIGKRAIDAACYADVLLAKQTARASKTPVAPKAPAPAFDGFADVPAI